MRFRQVGDEGIVVKQSEGEVLVVNEVGAAVMELIDGRRSLGEIIELVQPDYDVSVQALTQDVQEFARELLDAEIAETEV